MPIGNSVGSGAGAIKGKAIGEVIVDVKPKDARLSVRSFDRITGAMNKMNGALELVQQGMALITESVNTFTERSQLMAAAATRDFKQVQAAAGGLVSEMQALEFAAKLSNGTFQLTQAEMNVVGKAMRSLSRQGHDMNEVLEQVTTSLNEGNIDALENLGIILGEQAAPSGTIAAHRQAMEALRIEAEKLGTSQESAGEAARRSQIRLGDALDRLKAGFGELLVALTPLLEAMAKMVELAASVVGWVASQGDTSQVVDAAGVIDLGGIPSGSIAMRRQRAFVLAARARQGVAARNQIIGGAASVAGQAASIFGNTGIGDIGSGFGDVRVRPSGGIPVEIVAVAATVGERATPSMSLGTSAGGIDATRVGKDVDLITSGLSRPNAAVTAEAQKGIETLSALEQSAAGILNNVFATMAQANMERTDLAMQFAGQAIMGIAAELLAWGIAHSFMQDPGGPVAIAGSVGLFALGKKVSPKAKAFGAGRAAPRGGGRAQTPARHITIITGDQASGRTRSQNERILGDRLGAVSRT